MIVARSSIPACIEDEDEPMSQHGELYPPIEPFASGCFDTRDGRRARRGDGPFRVRA